MLNILSANFSTTLICQTITASKVKTKTVRDLCNGSYIEEGYIQEAVRGEFSISSVPCKIRLYRGLSSVCGNSLAPFLEIDESVSSPIHLSL
ncbi:hypothetical protein BMS3Bbin06_01084 [bacterium BMS3Bbin06]|nr:hypothetical protein BMS3Abin08_02171 [bacterium BMS3Abin08]GBE34558.1 hypothetical protein BMS3Bbin06_01084 [bacterium BMS3Bbin06]